MHLDNEFAAARHAKQVIAQMSHEIHPTVYTRDIGRKITIGNGCC